MVRVVSGRCRTVHSISRVPIALNRVGKRRGLSETPEPDNSLYDAST